MAIWLITGGGGWLGGHVLEALKSRLPGPGHIALLGRNRPATLNAERFISADLLDRESLASAVREIAPDHVLHIAGKTPPASEDDLHETNVRGTARLLDALQDLNRSVRVVLVGSAAELGPIALDDLPVVEDHCCRPTTPYGRSKLEMTTSALARRGSLQIIVARVFNLIGPGMPEALAFGRFAAQLATPAVGPIEIQAGRLDPRRDFVDVRDAARALADLAERGRPGRVYNVASGCSYTIREGLDRLVKLSGRTPRVVFDAATARSGEPDDTRADLSRITTEIGWRPEIFFERSIADLWASAVANRADTLPLTPGAVHL